MRYRATILLLMLSVFVLTSVIQSAGFVEKSYLQPILVPDPLGMTPTPTLTLTPIIMCTAPYCPDGSLVCPTGTCPGGCGVFCVTNTPASSATPTPTSTVSPRP